MSEGEKITVVTLLGIRFWDPVLERQVSDNLVVNAWPVSGYGPVTRAFCTASGVYAFQGLPGMQEYESGESAASGTKSFAVGVTDKLGRFLSTVFNVDLPLPYDGVYLSGPGADEISPPSSPPLSETPPGFYLFSAPWRTVSPGLAVIYASLKEQDTGDPAAYAVVEVQVVDGTEKWCGIADHRGCVAILFPYPKIPVSFDFSPPGPANSLDRQQWQLNVRVYYAPDTLTFPVNMEIPFLESILNQSPGIIWTTAPGSPDVGSGVSQWTTALTFGQELILKTEGADDSRLLIDANGAGPSPL